MGVWGLDTNPLQITRRRSLMCFMSVDAGMEEKKEDGQKTAGFVVYLPYEAEIRRWRRFEYDRRWYFIGHQSTKCPMNTQ